MKRGHSLFSRNAMGIRDWCPVNKFGKRLLAKCLRRDARDEIRQETVGGKVYEINDEDRLKEP